MLSNDVMMDQMLKSALQALSSEFHSLRVVNWDDPAAVKDALSNIEEYLALRAKRGLSRPEDAHYSTVVLAARRALGRTVM